MELLINLLTYSLPGGFLGAVFSWMANRRERDNDMLAKLQASINLLSEENRKILAENVQLRRENASLQANQEEMLAKLGALTREVEQLRSTINKLRNNRNENKNQRDIPHDSGNERPAGTGQLRRAERDRHLLPLAVCRGGEKRRYDGQRDADRCHSDTEPPQCERDRPDDCHGTVADRAGVVGNTDGDNDAPSVISRRARHTAPAMAVPASSSCGMATRYTPPGIAIR